MNILWEYQHRSQTKKKRDKNTSAIGSLRVFRVTLNLKPNFSSFLDKARTTVVKLLKSSSNFSIPSNKFTFSPPLASTQHNRLRCRRRIHELRTTVATSRGNPHTKPLSPINNQSAFFELQPTKFTTKTTKKKPKKREKAIQKAKEPILNWNRHSAQRLRIRKLECHSGGGRLNCYGWSVADAHESGIDGGSGGMEMKLRR